VDEKPWLVAKLDLAHVFPHVFLLALLAFATLRLPNSGRPHFCLCALFQFLVDPAV